MAPPKVSRPAYLQTGASATDQPPVKPQQGKWQQKRVYRFFHKIFSAFKISQARRAAIKDSFRKIFKRKVKQVPFTKTQVSTNSKSAEHSQRASSLPPQSTHSATHSATHRTTPKIHIPQDISPRPDQVDIPEPEMKATTRFKSAPDPESQLELAFTFPDAQASSSLHRESGSNNEITPTPSTLPKLDTGPNETISAIIPTPEVEPEHTRAEIHIALPDYDQPVFASVPLSGNEQQLQQELESQLGTLWKGHQLALNGQPVSAEQLSRVATPTSPLKLSTLPAANIQTPASNAPAISGEFHVVLPGSQETSILILPLNGNENDVREALVSSLGDSGKNLQLTHQGKAISARQLAALANPENPPQLGAAPLAIDTVLTPGFQNEGNQCFANAGLKQLILSLSPSDIPLLKENTKQLEREKTPEEAHNLLRSQLLSEGLSPKEASEALVLVETHSPAKARVTHAFAELAEAVLKARQSGHADNANISRLHKAFFDAVKAYGQSQESGASVFAKLFPAGKLQPQQDPAELLTPLFDLMGLNSLYPRLAYYQQVRSLDGQRTRHKSEIGSPLALIPAAKQKTLAAGFEPVQEMMTGDNKVRWDEGKGKVDTLRDSIKTDMFAHSDPANLKKVHVNAGLFAMDMYGRALRRGSEARDLLKEVPQTIPVTLFNKTTMKQEQYPFTIQSIVVHLGSDSARSGHYVTLEQQNGQWILHNDSRVTRLEGSLDDYFEQQKGAAPYLISLKRI